MSTDGTPGGGGRAEPTSKGFWPRFWFHVCKYSEYYYMLLVVVTVFAVLNGIAMLIGNQSTAAFVISTMVFAVLGITALAVGLVLLQCKKMRVPDSPTES